MKIVLLVTGVIVAIVLTGYLYTLQLGAIPFLLLAVFLINQAWKMFKQKD